MTGTADQPLRTRYPRGLLRLYVRVRDRLALAPGTDRDGAIERISRGIRQAGEGPWLLVCSCLLASIGLDVSSTAVVIGAMLISPLMSPILGVGLATALVDRPLLGTALRELAFSSLAALLTSTIYFTLSPLAEPTPELIARTTPTLLDVVVAFVGGVAGVVAGSRTRPSLALPGVAIATALMPPLCTAGFGLATGRWEFFFGALYLFVINAIFIALATFAVARWLHFPVRQYASAAARAHERRLLAVIVGVALLPSLWFLRDLALERRATGRIDRFVREAIVARGHDVLRWTKEPAGDSLVLRVVVAGRRITSAELDTLDRLLPAYGLEAARVQPIQSELSRDDLQRATSTVRDEVLTLLAAASLTRDSLTQARAALDREGAAATGAAAMATVDSAAVRRFGRELQRGFPEIAALSWMPVDDVLADDSAATAPVLVVRFAPRTPRAVQGDLRRRVEALARGRFGVEGLRVDVR